MSITSNEVKVWARLVGRVLLVFLGWCLVMLAYALIYGELERRAVPVGISPFLDIQAEHWDLDYYAKGSFMNTSAKDEGDELPLNSVDINCDKAAMNCTITTATEFESFMDLDISRYQVDSWDDKQIRFGDTSSICANWIYVIDRAGGTVSGLREKKRVIPDYALKSSLHPCDKINELKTSLVRGDQVHNQKIEDYRKNNVLGLHLFMVLLNLTYFAFIFRWVQRRRQRVSAS